MSALFLIAGLAVGAAAFAEGLSKPWRALIVGVALHLIGMSALLSLREQDIVRQCVAREVSR